MTYEDTPDFRREIAYTTDVAKLSSEIRILSIQENRENVDGPEEGLSALEYALPKLKKGTEGGDWIYFILNISDNYAHRGGPVGGRDYSLGALLNSVAQMDLNNFYIFDSTPKLIPWVLLESYAS